MAVQRKTMGQSVFPFPVSSGVNGTNQTSYRHQKLRPYRWPQLMMAYLGFSDFTMSKKKVFHWAESILASLVCSWIRLILSCQKWRKKTWPTDYELCKLCFEEQVEIKLTWNRDTWEQDNEWAELGLPQLTAALTYWCKRKEAVSSLPELAWSKVQGLWHLGHNLQGRAQEETRRRVEKYRYEGKNLTNFLKTLSRKSIQYCSRN